MFKLNRIGICFMAVKQIRFCIIWINLQFSTSLCTYVTPAISTKVFLYHLSILSHLEFRPHGTVLMYLKRYFKPTEAKRNPASL